MPKGHFVRSKEHCSNISKALKEKGIRPSFAGRKHTEESRKKISESLKGIPAWNKGIRGWREGADNHKNWKGDNVSYSGLHKWIYRKLGNPSHCIQCGCTGKRRYEWANKSGQYKRDLTDWLRLCKSCHKKYDNAMKRKAGIKIKGVLTIRVMRGDKLIQEVTKKNLVVNAGLELLANRISDATPTSGCLINYIATGTGTNVPNAADTQLQTENARKAVSSRTNSGAIAAISTVFNAGEVPTSTLREVGTFIDGTGTANSGTLFARQNVNIAVTALDSVFIDWRITFASA